MNAFTKVLKNGAAALLAVALCLGAFPAAAQAEEWQVDLDAVGSITVEIKDTGTGEAVKGGTIILCKAADAVEDEGYKFVYTEEFASFTDPIAEDADLTPELAKKLADAAATSPNLVTKEVGEEPVVFDSLAPGLYVISQPKAADGYEPVAPFLVTVPFKGEDGKLQYDVDARPKVEKARKSTPTPTPPVTKTPPPKLPQTGQLWWPVPLLVIAGLLFILAGWRRKRADSGK